MLRNRLLLALLAAFVVSVAAVPVVKSVEITEASKGTTTVELSKKGKAALKKLRLSLTPEGEATGTPNKITMPITKGDYDFEDRKGTLEHEGSEIGLSVGPFKVPVLGEIKKVTIGTAKNIVIKDKFLSFKIGSKSVKIFSIDWSDGEVEGNTITGSTLTPTAALTDIIAQAIGKKFKKLNGSVAQKAIKAAVNALIKKVQIATVDVDAGTPATTPTTPTTPTTTPAP